MRINWAARGRAGCAHISSVFCCLGVALKQHRTGNSCGNSWPKSGL